MTAEDDIALVPLVLRAIAWLLCLLGAPVRAWRRYRDYGRDERVLLEAALRALGRRGYRLRYDGEDDATVRKRLEMIERFIADPRRFIRHLARLARRYGRIVRTSLSGATPKLRPHDDPLAKASVHEVCSPDSS